MKIKKIVSIMLISVLTSTVLIGCETKESKYPTYPEYEANQYVKLEKYKNLDIKAQQISTEPTEKEINSYINKIIPAEEIKDKDATAKEGDVVSISYTGKINGEKITHGSAKNMGLIIGDGKLIPEFEKQLIGMKAQDKKHLKISFPSDYSNEELAGKTADFDVEIDKIARTPKLTDEKVKNSTNNSIKTVKELKETAKKDLTEMKKSQNRELSKSAVFSKLKETSTIKDAPKKLTDWYVDSKITAIKIKAENNGMSVNEYIEQDAEIQNTYPSTKTEKELKENYKKDSKKPLQYEMLMDAIAEKEKIKVTEKEYKEQSESMARQMGFKNVEEFENKMGKNLIEHQILIDKTIDFIIKNNNFTAIETTYDINN